MNRPDEFILSREEFDDLGIILNHLTIEDQGAYEKDLRRTIKRLMNWYVVAHARANEATDHE